MKNIITIAKDDFKSLSRNTIALIVIICLVCVPAMYAWLNTAASWDPYKSTSELRIAVANDDAGYEGKYLPVEVNIGNTVVSNLHENTTFKWEFTTTDQAIEGVTSGEYYAALVIPESFSTSLMEFIKTGAQPAQITYYTNEKLNPIAPKVTGKGASTIQKSVSTQFVSSIADALIQVMQGGVELINSEDIARLKTTLSEALDTSSSALQSLSGQLRTMSSLLGTAQPLIDAISGILPGSGSASQTQLKSTLSNIRAQIVDLQSDLDTARKELQGVEGSEEILAIIDEIDSLASKLASATDNASATVDAAGVASDSQIAALKSLGVLLADVCTKLTSASISLDDAAASLATTKDSLEALSNDTSLDSIKELLSQDSTQLSKIIASPVTLNRTALYPFENTGSSMVALYTSLAIWIGLTLLLSMAKTEVSRERLEKTERKTGRPVKAWESYLGRYVLFAAVSLFQATFIALGDIFFLGIQCAHPVLFILTCWVISLVFSLFIYTLVVSFGSIGKALAVILLVMQVAGTGGMFPIEMMDAFFQAVYPFLPFSYTISALHACCAGIYQYELLYYLVCLVATLVPLSLLLGLVLRLPMIKVNKYLVSKIEETEVMG